MDEIKTYAFVYHEPGVVKREQRVIRLGSSDLLARVLVSARCGTDKMIFQKGHYKVDKNAPIVLGHEFTAEIVFAGKEVKNLTTGTGYKEGDELSGTYLEFHEGERITCQSRIARYRNGLMLLEEPITILSFYIDGAYSQYVMLPKQIIQSGSVMRLPESVSDEEGALVEPAACALESIYATAHPVGVDEQGRHLYSSGVKCGGKACIIGSGTVSMIYALLCKIYGSEEVFMIVRSFEKAEMVRRMLGTEINVVVIESYDDLPLEEKLEKEKGIVAELSERTGGMLFDDVVSACASADAQRLMMELYSPAGYAVGACFGALTAWWTGQT